MIILILCLFFQFTVDANYLDNNTVVGKMPQMHEYRSRSRAGFSVGMILSFECRVGKNYRYISIPRSLVVQIPKEPDELRYLVDHSKSIQDIIKSVNNDTNSMWYYNPKNGHLVYRQYLESKFVLINDSQSKFFLVTYANFQYSNDEYDCAIYRLAQLFGRNIKVSSYFLKDGYTVIGLFEWPEALGKFKHSKKYWINEINKLKESDVIFYNSTHIGISWISEYSKQFRDRQIKKDQL
jgi:hypothetical protein